ncbi:MAG: hypothetical protein EPN94_12135 [Nitrospirae bacterium]|nr:MAG: hypothetical protein EPN94_12135 [Nitrospirota bacterium]
MLKYIRSLFRNFDWPFTISPRSQEETISIYNAAWNITGFKEALSNNVYFYKKRFIETGDKEIRSMYYAEAYQRLIDKMAAAHEAVLKRERIIKEKS